MNSQTGFTLIETIIVLCLFILITSFGCMQISFLDSTLAHAELNKLACVCEYLQHYAITTNSEQVLMCDEHNNRYDSQMVHEKVASPISFGFLAQGRGSPGTPSATIKKAITFVDNTIHFYPTGIISSGTIYLVDKKKQYMYALSNAISKNSYLRLYRYDHQWKLLNKS